MPSPMNMNTYFGWLSPSAMAVAHIRHSASAQMIARNFFMIVFLLVLRLVLLNKMYSTGGM